MPRRPAYVRQSAPAASRRPCRGKPKATNPRVRQTESPDSINHTLNKPRNPCPLFDGITIFDLGTGLGVATRRGRSKAGSMSGEQKGFGALERQSRCFASKTPKLKHGEGSGFSSNQLNCWSESRARALWSLLVQTRDPNRAVTLASGAAVLARTKFAGS